jgi:hypothetical protein
MDVKVALVVLVILTVIFVVGFAYIGYSIWKDEPKG